MHNDINTNINISSMLGAVDPSIGAKRVIHEIGLLNLESAGTFINCEDGLQIPW